MSKKEFNCPRVPEGFGFGKQHWEKVGEDTVCSGCRSIHPAELRTIADAIIKGDYSKGLLQSTDKSYKLYIQRDHVSNATEGAIKFYSHHGPSPDSGQDEFFEVINQAIEVSKPELDRKTEAFLEKMRGQHNGSPEKYEQ